MNNLANTYGSVGRLDDAAAMHQRTLEFRQRVLPEDHPTIGAALCYGCDDCGLFDFKLKLTLLSRHLNEQSCQYVL